VRYGRDTGGAALLRLGDQGQGVAVVAVHHVLGLPVVQGGEVDVEAVELLVAAQRIEEVLDAALVGDLHRADENLPFAEQLFVLVLGGIEGTLGGKHLAWKM
jgi:hypothetical protein